MLDKRIPFLFLPLVIFIIFLWFYSIGCYIEIYEWVKGPGSRPIELRDYIKFAIPDILLGATMFFYIYFLKGFRVFHKISLILIYSLCVIGFLWLSLGYLWFIDQPINEMLPAFLIGGIVFIVPIIYSIKKKTY